MLNLCAKYCELVGLALEVAKLAGLWQLSTASLFTLLRASSHLFVSIHNKQS